MNRESFKSLCEEAFELVRKMSPYKTGNLRFHGVQLDYPSPNVAIIYVDMAEAPYMPYTNEPWLSPYWGGKKNPNEGWWDRAAEAVAERIMEILGG